MTENRRGGQTILRSNHHAHRRKIKWPRDDNRQTGDRDSDTITKWWLCVTRE